MCIPARHLHIHDCSLGPVATSNIDSCTLGLSHRFHVATLEATTCTLLDTFNQPQQQGVQVQSSECPVTEARSLQPSATAQPPVGAPVHAGHAAQTGYAQAGAGGNKTGPPAVIDLTADDDPEEDVGSMRPSKRPRSRQELPSPPHVPPSSPIARQPTLQLTSRAALNPGVAERLLAQDTPFKLARVRYAMDDRGRQGGMMRAMHASVALQRGRKWAMHASQVEVSNFTCALLCDFENSSRIYPALQGG